MVTISEVSMSYLPTIYGNFMCMCYLYAQNNLFKRYIGTQIWQC